jgi:ATP-dependent Clp protease adaptor protein ClpS
MNDVPVIEKELVSDADEKVQEPPLYKVLLYNDDYTTKEFVVGLLMAVFNKSMGDATQLMLNVHKSGVGVCGVFSYEVAETKVNTSIALARENGFPLKLSMEEDD